MGRRTRLFHLLLFPTASRMVSPKILVLTARTVASRADLQTALIEEWPDGVENMEGIARHKYAPRHVPQQNRKQVLTVIRKRRFCNRGRDLPALIVAAAPPVQVRPRRS